MWMGTSGMLLALAASLGAPGAESGSRLSYLDEFCDPYYVGLDTPKLITPQWVGEEGVEAVRKMNNNGTRAPGITVVPLTKDGCVNTEVDMEKALRVLRLGCTQFRKQPR